MQQQIAQGDIGQLQYVNMYLGDYPAVPDAVLPGLGLCLIFIHLLAFAALLVNSAYDRSGIGAGETALKQVLRFGPVINLWIANSS